MPRPELHSTDRILDAARSVALESGVGAATIASIARESGAPVGTLYHRFGSRDELLARAWIRAARRAQEAVIASASGLAGTDAIVTAALAVIDFCEFNPKDARMLVSFRREDLLAGDLPPTLVAELEELNRPLERCIKRLARDIHGSAGAQSTEIAALAIFDLPYGAARRHLIAGRSLPGALRRHVEVAVRAIVAMKAPSSSAV